MSGCRSSGWLYRNLALAWMILCSGTVARYHPPKRFLQVTVGYPLAVPMQPSPQTSLQSAPLPILPTAGVFSCFLFPYDPPGCCSLFFRVKHHISLCMKLVSPVLCQHLLYCLLEDAVRLGTHDLHSVYEERRCSAHTGCLAVTEVLLDFFRIFARVQA